MTMQELLVHERTLLGALDSFAGTLVRTARNWPPITTNISTILPNAGSIVAIPTNSIAFQPTGCKPI